MRRNKAKAGLTEAQRKALKLLAKGESWPAEIGYEITKDRPGRRLKAQGAGWIGGAMGTRLAKMGLAFKHGWPRGYTITAAGRALLASEQAGQ